MKEKSKTKVTSKKITALSTVSKKTQSNSLPSITVLGQKTWDLFAKTWLTYFKLIAAGIALFVIIVISGFLLALPLGISFLGSHGDPFRNLSIFQMVMVGILILWILLAIVAGMIYSLFFSVASVILLHNPKQQTFSNLIKESKSLLLPFFLTGLLIAFLVYGGFFLLIIPGILIAVFFFFSFYEVVLEKQKSIAALRNSYLLVKNHFWQILGRLLLIEFVVVVLSLTLNNLVERSAGLSLLLVAFNFAASWFTQSYSYNLYKQVKTVSKKEATSGSMGWIWIVAIVGWSLLLAIVIAISQGLAHLLQIPTNIPKNIPTGTV